MGPSAWPGPPFRRWSCPRPVARRPTSPPRPAPRCPACWFREGIPAASSAPARITWLPVAPPETQHWYGWPRLRWCVEEVEELPVRAFVRLRETGRASVVFPGTFRIRFGTHGEAPAPPVALPPVSTGAAGWANGGGTTERRGYARARPPASRAACGMTSAALPFATW